MLTQAEGLRYGVEHYRRNPRSGGSLIWQLNDSWPGTSWAMIDYELLPKASYYYAKKFYAPLLLSLEHEPGQPLRVWAVNDGPEPTEVEVVLEVWHFDGEKVGEYVFRSGGAFRGPVLLGEIGEAEALNGGAAEETLVRLRHADGMERVSGDGGVSRRREERDCEQTYMLRDPRELKLGQAKLAWSLTADPAEEAADGGQNAGERDIRAAWLLDGQLAEVTAAALSQETAKPAGPIRAASGGLTVTVEASGMLARMVKLELPLGRVHFSDNFFDLLPGERREVQLSMLDGSPLREEFVRGHLRVSAINGKVH
jgi:beta-mannosidase